MVAKTKNFESKYKLGRREICTENNLTLQERQIQTTIKGGAKEKRKVTKQISWCKSSGFIYMYIRALGFVNP